MSNCVRHEKREQFQSDYRFSHLSKEKSESYNSTFINNPYRKMVWDLEKIILDDIYKLYLTGSNLHHLDFACGTGRILSHYSDRFDISVGVDVSSSMISVARRNQPFAELFQADITREDVLEDRNFDLITAFRFFPNAQSALREESMHALIGHLKENGVIVLNNHKNTRSLKYKLARLRLRGGNEGMSLQEVRDLANRHGLRIVRMYSTAYIPANEGRSILPICLVRKMEEFLLKCRCFIELGENVVFVCQKQ